MEAKAIGVAQHSMIGEIWTPLRSVKRQYGYPADGARF